MQTKQDKNNGHNFYFIYFMQQADWLIKQGVMPIGAGVGAKGDAYVLFKKNEYTQQMMRRWAEVQATKTE